MSTKLYILRHAETDKNIIKSQNITLTSHFKAANPTSSGMIDLGSSSLMYNKNCTLNHNGKEQAKIVGDYFKTMDHKITAIYSSPLIRAVETADIIIKRLSPGEDVSIDFNIDDRLYCSKTNKMMCEADLLKDINELILEMISKYKGYDIVMVTHNHIFNVINKLYIQKPQEKTKVSNCSLSCIEFTSSVPKPLYWTKKIKINYELIE